MTFKSPKYILSLFPTNCVILFDSLGKVEISDDSETGTADYESSEDRA